MPGHINQTLKHMRVFSLLIFISFVGCSSTKHTSELPPLYQAPSIVAKADREECEERARNSTQDLNQKILEKWDENFLVQNTINAALGTLTGFWRLPKRPSNKAAKAGRTSYESVMKSCLRAKGYSL